MVYWSSDLDEREQQLSNNMPITSDKYKEVEAALGEDARPVFRRLVEEYEYLTQLHFGRGYVAYGVLADLVRAGWRPTADPTPDSRL